MMPDAICFVAGTFVFVEFLVQANKNVGDGDDDDCAWHTPISRNQSNDT